MLNSKQNRVNLFSLNTVLRCFNKRKLGPTNINVSFLIRLTYPKTYACLKNGSQTCSYFSIKKNKKYKKNLM